MPSSINGMIAVLLLTLGAVLVDYARVLRLRRRLPPGPFPFPVVGNHFQTPKVRPWVEWQQWAQDYDSPMITLWIGRKPVIIVSDAWVASELMEKKASTFATRPRMIVLGEAISKKPSNQIGLPYGDRWRMHRRIMHVAVGTQAVRKYRSFQADESRIMTRDLLEHPDEYVVYIERYTISVVSIVGWGRRISGPNDHVAQLALKLMEGVSLAIPGVFILETIPELLKLPSWLYTFPSTLRTGFAAIQGYFYLLTQEAAQSRPHTFGKYVLTEQQKQGLSNMEVANIMGNLIGGGVDTTSSTTISFVLAMACFPDVQRRAQAEIDSVVGQDRSPTWDDIDRARLPYLTAIMEEVLRWRTVTVLAGIPHANQEAVEYRGYHFPARTQFTSNMWAIHRNTRDFPDPDEFRPERFLNGLKNPYPNSRGSNPFGWGKRICSGQPLAEQGLLYTFGRMLWAFHIRPGLDEAGNEVKLDIFAYTESENIRPKPFKARFIPRSDSIRDLIMTEATKAREALRVYDGETKVTMDDVMANNPISL